MLGELIDLRVQLARDEAMPTQQRRERDREVGQSVDNKPPLTQVRAWLERTIRQEHDPSPGERVTAGQRLLVLLLVLVAVLLGGGAAAGLLWYDGTTPVNVVWLLAFFVVLQWVVLIGTVLVAATGTTGLSRTLQWAGLGGVVGEALQWVQRRRTQRRQKDPLGEAERHARAVLTRYGPVQKWLVFQATQMFALFFNAAAVTTALLLILTTDLAFGWATTVDPVANRFGQVVRVLSVPWAWAWPEAVPSRELIELSRYNRADASTWVNAADQLGNWWPFVLMSMLVYGLLPRVITAGIVSFVTRRVLRQAVLDESRALRDRMARPMVRPDVTSHGEADTAGHADAPAVEQAAHEMHAVTLAWDGVPCPDERAVAVGGAGHSVDQDHLAIEAAAQRATSNHADGNDRPSGVSVYVPAHEAPTLDLADRLKELRDAMGKRGRGLPVVIVPVYTFAAGEAKRQRDAASWRAFVAERADPWLQLAEPIEHMTGAADD